MTEEQLIKQLKSLKEIKPREEWVVLAKSQIFKKEEKNQATFNVLDIFSAFSFRTKMAYSLATMSLIVAGLFGFAQYTSPGDTLFTVRKITEQSQAALTGSNVLQNNLNVASKRMDDLAQAVKSNKTENISSAVSELKASIAEVTKSLNESGSQNGQSIKDVAMEAKKIKDNTTLLDNLGGEESSSIKETSDELYKIVDEQMIGDLEKTTLTEEQEKQLTEAKDLFDDEKYADALEIILLINK